MSRLIVNDDCTRMALPLEEMPPVPGVTVVVDSWAGFQYDAARQRWEWTRWMFPRAVAEEWAHR